AIAGELRDVVAALDPALYDGRDAARLTEVAAEVERLGAAARLLFGRRAVDTRGWVAGSSAATPEQWFAHASGCSEPQAREALATADRITGLATTEARLRDGSLSVSQAALVSRAATLDPESEPKLLKIAGRGEFRTLRAEHERVVAAATDAEEAQARAHRDRHLRTWTRGVETHGAFSGPTSEVDTLLRALEPLRRQAFEQGRTEGRRESQDVYMYDALIGLARGEKHENTSEPVARVRVDLTPVLRGKTEPGEICEIPGVGPVPVSVARQVLSHGLLELVLHDGKDVRAIVTRTRHVPEALKIAIEERDQRCKIRGCDATQHLQRHHIEDYAEHHRTSYEILGLICADDHDRVTHRGYTIEIHDDGTWSLHPPDEQRDTSAA
ncbi:MAG TPA: hypothetical protein VIH82_00620, partial [Acidimicrobiia bacterium]